MTAREHLESYGLELRKEKCKYEELLMLRTNWMAPGVQMGDGMPHAHGNVNGLDVYAAAMDRITRQIREGLGRAEEIRAEIIGALDRMDKPEERQVLYLRYLCMLTWDQVADKMHYDRRTATRIHGRALTHYVVPVQDVQDVHDVQEVQEGGPYGYAGG